jgi:hypothetical protein
MLRILGWVFLLSMGCSSAQRAKVEQDAKKALDEACNARAMQKLVEADAGH